MKTIVFSHFHLAWKSLTSFISVGFFMIATKLALTLSSYVRRHSIIYALKDDVYIAIMTIFVISEKEVMKSLLSLCQSASNLT